MATYKCYDDLVGKQLKFDDQIDVWYDIFKVSYAVGYHELYSPYSNENENEIFKLLGLDPHEFCASHYTELPRYYGKYKINHPNWFPPFRDGDYESITKAILELFRIIEEDKALAETSTTLFID